jgi:hypothetical protein
MSYSNPNRRCYSFGELDVADAAETLSIKGPAGKAGRLVGVAFSATETFNAVTTSAKIQVGTAADPDAYAQLDLGTLADTDSLDASEQSGAIIDPAIPADTQVEITCVANTGGTPAGKGFLHVFVDWDW